MVAVLFASLPLQGVLTLPRLGLTATVPLALGVIVIAVLGAAVQPTAIKRRVSHIALVAVSLFFFVIIALSPVASPGTAGAAASLSFQHLQITLVLLSLLIAWQNASAFIGAVIAYVIGALVASVVTLVEWLDIDQVGRHAAGDLGVNTQAHLIVVGVVLCFLLQQAFLTKRWFWWLLVPTALIMMAAVLATGSRGALLSLLLLFAFSFLFRLRQHLGLLAITFGLATTVYFFSGAPAFTGLQRLAERSTAELVDNGRFDLWNAAIQVQSLSGQGAGSGLESATGLSRQVHNAFLSLTTQFGVLGVLAWIGLQGVFMLIGVEAARSRQPLQLVLAFAILVPLLLNNWEHRTATWLLIAVAANASRIQAPPSRQAHSVRCLRTRARGS